MPENYWSEDEPNQEIDPLSSLLGEWSDPEDEEEEFRSEFFQGLSGRRRKAAFLLMLVWSITIGLHLMTWGTGMVFALTAFLLLQGLRLLLTTPETPPQPLLDEALDKAPTVSMLVAAKNEEAVISNLVTMLCGLDYPTDRYEVWIIDDRSTDRTPAILDRLARQYPQLNVIHRPAGASGGKSGALNQVLPFTKGDIIGVFDADAHVPQDLLRYVISLFEPQEVGAVQVRKAIANHDTNFWTKGQMAEMALDSYFQQQRIASGGIGELRGNGQFVRRTALEQCGGWNEQTITDDLDLTFRLHLDNWKVDLLLSPAVEEEGVTRAIALWHQRNRWGEGGFQRYLDYWRFMLGNRLGFRKKLDLLYFMLVHYILPSAALPDVVMSIARHRLPILSPANSVILSLSCWGMFTGLRRIHSQEKLSFSSLLGIIWQTLRGMLYMMHWFIVIPSITARMSIRPKRLKWVKTSHEGTADLSSEFSG